MVTGLNPIEAAASVAGAESPLHTGPQLTSAADSQELSFREEIEAYPEPFHDVPRFIDSKRLPELLEEVLVRTGITPKGVVVELGAGVCWLTAAMARRSEVTRVVAVEFSRRRLRDLAPISIAHLEAPPHKVERIVADFHAPGLPDGTADLVVTDAAFHHAANPGRLAQVACQVLRPGGTFLLMREPTITPRRRQRDHGAEGEHGDFEHEYRRGEYLQFLQAAGFTPESYAAPGNLGTVRGRIAARPPFSWLNGIAFSEYVYVGRKPAEETR